MIYIRTATLNDIFAIKQILKENELNPEKADECLSNSMIALDNNIPIATAGFVADGDIAIIKFVAVIKSRHREYIGDGIVKAILSLADTRGITKVLVAVDDKWSEFFKKVGFKEFEPTQEYISNLKLHIHIKNEKEQILQVILPDFFTTACRSNQ